MYSQYCRALFRVDIVITSDISKDGVGYGVLGRGFGVGVRVGVGAGVGGGWWVDCWLFIAWRLLGNKPSAGSIPIALGQIVHMTYITEPFHEYSNLMQCRMGGQLGLSGSDETAGMLPKYRSRRNGYNSRFHKNIHNEHIMNMVNITTGWRNDSPMPPGDHRWDYHIGKILKLIFLIAKLMGPTWGPSGADRTQVGPMLAPWTLLSGVFTIYLDDRAPIYW